MLTFSSMPLHLPINAKERQTYMTFGRTSLLMIGYLFLTAFFVQILEPGMTPPGFTGRGAYAMGVIFLGAFHLAGKSKNTCAFLIFGGLGGY